MPLANGFLRREDFAGEYFFELKAGFCGRCSLVQLIDTVPREKMFHDRYPFFTSSSERMKAHFSGWAARLLKELPAARDPFVVEIGSNDGTMLEPIAAAGIRHLGIEPSANVDSAARQKGLATLRRFFDEETARQIVRDQGQADAIVAANCFCHIPDLNSLATAALILLKPDGILTFEDPYLGDIVSKTAYDQIYDEHAHYFSIAAVAYWLGSHGLEIVDAAPQDVHGGSMRYTICRRGVRRGSPRVQALRQEELKLGLHLPETYARLRGRIERSREELVALLGELKQKGKRVAGYAATSKSTTVFNYCGITAELVEFISDTTPLKQGKFSPGAHIPVRPHAEFQARYPDYALLLAWNHAAEIMDKEPDFRRSGGKWISYVPRVAVSP